MEVDQEAAPSGLQRWRRTRVLHRRVVHDFINYMNVGGNFNSDFYAEAVDDNGSDVQVHLTLRVSYLSDPGQHRLIINFENHVDSSTVRAVACMYIDTGEKVIALTCARTWAAFHEAKYIPGSKLSFHSQKFRKKTPPRSILDSLLDRDGSLCVVCEVTLYSAGVPAPTLCPHPFRMEYSEEASTNDVTLRAADGTQVQSCRFVLMYCSAVFRVMLADERHFKESNEGVIQMEDVQGPALISFVRYLHTGALEAQALRDQASSLLYLSEKYDVHSLR